MKFFSPGRFFSLALVATVYAAPTVAHGQRRPSSEAVQANPQMLDQLRQRILTSGLTPDQVRARLRAEGYSETLLDAYLPGGTANSAEGTEPPEQVFAAIQQLGIIDSVEVDLLRCGLNPDSISVSDTLRNGQVDTTTLRNGQLDTDTLRNGQVDTVRAGRRMSERNRLALQRCRRASQDSLGRRVRLGKAEIDSGFQIFGLDFFRQTNNLFEANLPGPVDAGYRVGPGDRLVLILTGDVEQSYTLDVTREGFIIIPTVGQLWVNNLSLAELENVLYTRLGRVYSGVRRGAGATTRFYITPTRVRSNQIFVVGDVLRPGSFRISSLATALTALYAARGPSDNGSLRAVQIKRGNRLVATLDVYDYLLNGNSANDIRMETGDRVFVPVHGPRVRIVGEISRPATYEILPGETLADALRFAGGFTATAARQRVQIERIVPPTQRALGGRDRIVTDVVSDQFANGTGPAFRLESGDIIRVFAVSVRVRNRISVRGNVWAPGLQGLSPGMRISDALRLAGGVKPDAFLGQVLITRTNPDSTRTQLRAALRDTANNVLNDFPLREDDEIRVFSTSEFRPTRYVAINGAVQKSGQFAFREGMTVRDLVLLAGGLEQSAFLNEAEIARLPETRIGGVTARTFRVPLDSSYIFERGPNGEYLGPPGLPAPMGPSAEIVVKPYDNVLILRQPNWELQRTAVVTGEVRFPGRYSLRTKNERITDLIKRAGGLTPDGYANGVTFYRKGGRVGRIGIELPEVLKDSRSPDNLPLVDGDSIFIPRYNAVVNVKGAVNSPVSVTFVRGQPLDYYIRAAGGPAVRADVSRAYVTQPNGKVDARAKHFLIPDSSPKPEAGSTVFVPQREAGDRPPGILASAGSVAQILATLVTVIIALRR